MEARLSSEIQELILIIEKWLLQFIFLNIYKYKNGSVWRASELLGMMLQ